jgi:plastocyanin
MIAAGVLLALLVVWLAAGRSSDDSDRAAAPRATVSAESGLRFSPSVLRLPVGGVGLFTNKDSMAHTFTADGGLFDSGPVEPGRPFTFSFPSPGEVTYHCEIHPSMKGRVVVEAEGEG